MILPKKKEIVDKLSDLLKNNISRTEVAKWATEIAAPFPMHLVNFQDKILDEAFISLQIADAKLGIVSPHFFPNSLEYYVTDKDLHYWLTVLEEIFEPQVTKFSRLRDVHPLDFKNIGDFYDIIWNISYEKFTEITGLLSHSSLTDLYFEKFVFFSVDEINQIMITWDMAYGVEKGVVYSNTGNSDKTSRLLLDLFGNAAILSDKTSHH